MKPSNLNLYIVDDDDALRRSLVSLLNSHLRDFSLRDFESGEAFLEGADLDSNGVVVMDLRMEPGMSGLEVFNLLQERKSQLAIVFLSGHGTIPDAVRAMEGGAVSWLIKPCANEELVQVVQRAKERALQIAMRRSARKHALALWATLTAREKQMALPCAQGKSSKLVSKEFTAAGDPVERRTVDGYRAKIMAKLEVPNTNALLAFLTEHDLTDETRSA